MSDPTLTAAPVFRKVIVGAVTAALVPLIVRYGNDLLGSPIDEETAARWAVSIATAAFTFITMYLTPERLGTVRAYYNAHRAAGDQADRAGAAAREREDPTGDVLRARAQEPTRSRPEDRL